MDELREEMDELKELLETKQYTRLRQNLAEVNDADIAAFIESLDEEDLLKVFRILPKASAADVFSYLEVENQQLIITALSDKEAANIIDNLMAFWKKCLLILSRSCLPMRALRRGGISIICCVIRRIVPEAS